MNARGQIPEETGGVTHEKVAATVKAGGFQNNTVRGRDVLAHNPGERLFILGPCVGKDRFLGRLDQPVQEFVDAFLVLLQRNNRTERRHHVSDRVRHKAPPPGDSSMGQSNHESIV